MSDPDINESTDNDKTGKASEAASSLLVVLIIQPLILFLVSLGLYYLLKMTHSVFPSTRRLDFILSSYIWHFIDSVVEISPYERKNVFTGNSQIVRPISEDCNLGGNWVYLAEPTNAKIKEHQGLIYFSNSSGIAPNTRALADEFARAGYVTVVINYWGRHQDMYQNRGMTPFDPRDPKREPDEDERQRMIRDALNYLRKDRECTQIGGVGYCGGAPPLMDLLVRKPCRLTAAFMAHPARVKTKDFGRIQAPLSLAQTWDDRFVDPQMRHEQESELIDLVKLSANEKKDVQSGKLLPRLPWQMNLYSNVVHGFGARLLDEGQMTRDEIFAKRAAFNQAVMWFETHMPQHGEKKKYYTR